MAQIYIIYPCNQEYACNQNNVKQYNKKNKQNQKINATSLTESKIHTLVSELLTKNHKKPFITNLKTHSCLLSQSRADSRAVYRFNV